MSDHLSFIHIRGLQGDAEECFQGLSASASASASGGSSSSSSNSSGGGTTTTTALEWGSIPEIVLTQMQDYTVALNDWLAAAQAYNPDSESRGLPAVIGAAPALPAIVGAVVGGTAALPAVATVVIGQALLNFVGTMATNYAASLDQNSPQNILKKALLYEADGETKSILRTGLLDSANAAQLDLLKSAVEKIGAHLETALLYGDGDAVKSILRTGLLDESDAAKIVGILKKALLYQPDPTKADIAGVLPKALIYTPDPDKPAEQHGVLEDKLNDLALVDATVTFGDDVKHRVNGKVMEF